MSVITAITGKVGSGKGLYAVSQIARYAMELKRRVVANFAVNLAPLQSPVKRWLGVPIPEVERIADRPTYEQLIALGRGGMREDLAGLLVLDEVGPLLDARSWQDKSRKGVIDWLLHTRKLGWDILLIVQNLALLDKQIRVAVVESTVTCRRLDRIRVPVVKIRLPRLHLAVERYGSEGLAPVASRTWFRGNRYFSCYDTQQLFGELAEMELEAIPEWQRQLRAELASWADEARRTWGLEYMDDRRAA